MTVADLAEAGLPNDVIVDGAAIAGVENMAHPARIRTASAAIIEGIGLVQDGRKIDFLFIAHSLD
ncbi:hypothetical protein [Glaciimonas sp. PAMC28666]|uniref:hypothetical protein n=1 Tax=Glaciimonas sp. PAMC28666 TaxID=2807626 RepID=UPI00196510CF|nr:hypothetical protein [Glaciimonas sp. PAMC28666]QRX81073.1 hypothetical protein JQN73_12745 [Glaciimonas sp. PAMC28666]